MLATDYHLCSPEDEPMDEDEDDFCEEDERDDDGDVRLTFLQST